LAVFKRSKEQWKTVISQEGKKRKAVEDFINDFKFPAKKDRPNAAASRPIVQEFKTPVSNEESKTNGATKVPDPEISSPIQSKKISSSDTDNDTMDFVIDTKGDEGLRDQMDTAPKVSSEKKKKKKKAKSYLDDL
jgi:hypothetical protein